MFCYDYKCKECENKFEVICAADNRDDVWKCPKCSSNNTVRLFTTQRFFNKGTFEQKGDAYWQNAEKVRVKKQEARFKEHSDKYRHDKEYRLKENKRLHNRGIPKSNLPDGDLI